MSDISKLETGKARASVLSIFNRLRLKDDQQPKVNDKLVETSGKYLGKIPMTDAHVLRKWQDTLAIKRQQAEFLVADVTQTNLDYLDVLASIMQAMKMDTSEVGTGFIYIGTDGNLWLVPREKITEFSAIYNAKPEGDKQ